jgi:predicted DNA binding protein
MFIKKVIEIDKDDYATKANEHRGEVLDYFSLITKDVKTHLYTIKYEDILCTMNEYQNCVEENANLITSDDSFWQFAPNPKIFKDSIANALNTLDYNATYVLLGPESQQLFYNANDNIEITSPNGRVDELALFISLYKNTFA